MPWPDVRPTLRAMPTLTAVPPAAVPAPDDLHAPPPFGWPRALAVNFAPGVLTIAVLTAVRPLLEALGWPPVAGYTIAIAVVTVLELLYLGMYGQAVTGRFSVRAATSFRARLPRLRVAVTSLGFVAGTAALLGLLEPVTAAIARATDVLPAWWSPDVTDTQVAVHGQTALVVALLAKLLVDALLNPYVEELYWKGHLMPRLPLRGFGQALAAGVLFSAEHFWQPSEFLLVAVVQVGLCWYTLRSRSLDVAITTHWVVNSVVTLLALAAVLG